MSEFKVNVKIFNEFCYNKQCPEYVEWGAGFGSCVSCQLVGQSYNIDEYPDNCLFLEEIKKYENERI